MDFQVYSYGHGDMSERKKPRRSMDSYMQGTQGQYYSNSPGAVSTAVPFQSRIKTDRINAMSSVFGQPTGNMNFMSSGFGQSTENMNFVSPGIGKSTGNMEFVSPGISQSAGNMEFMSSDFGQSTGNMNFVSQGFDQSIENMNLGSNLHGQSGFGSTTFDQSTVSFGSSGLHQSYENMNFPSDGYQQSSVIMNKRSSGFDQLSTLDPNLTLENVQNYGKMSSSGLYAQGTSDRDAAVMRRIRKMQSMEQQAMKRGVSETLPTTGRAAQHVDRSRIDERFHTMDREQRGIDRSREERLAMKRNSLELNRRINERLNPMDREQGNMEQPIERRSVGRKRRTDERFRPSDVSRPRSSEDRYAVERMSRGMGRTYGRPHTIERNTYVSESRVVERFHPMDRDPQDVDRGNVQRHHLEREPRGMNRALERRSSMDRDIYSRVDGSMYRHDRGSRAREREVADRSLNRAAAERSLNRATADRSLNREAADRSLNRAAADRSLNRAAADRSLNREAADRSLNRAAADRSLNRAAADRSLNRAAADRSLNRAAADRSLNRAAADRSLNREAADRSLNRAAADRSLNRAAADRSLNRADADRSLNRAAADRSLNTAVADRSLNRAFADRSLNRAVLDSNNGSLRDTRDRHSINVSENRRRQDINVKMPMNRYDTEHKRSPDMVTRGSRDEQRMEVRDPGPRAGVSGPSHGPNQQKQGVLRDGGHNPARSTPGMAGLKRYNKKQATSVKKGKGKKSGNKKLKTSHEKVESVEEQISRLIALTKQPIVSSKTDTDPAHCFNNAFCRSNISLKKHFSSKRFYNVGNGKMETAWLFIGEIFLARAFGTDKSDNKKECFEKAGNVLLTKSVKEILQQKDPGIDSFAEELLSNYENMPLEDFEMEHVEQRTAKFKSLRQKVKPLMEYLNCHNTSRTEVVEHLETALKESKCELIFEYSDEELEWYNGMPWFIGTSRLGGIVIAAASGACRESAKKNTYEQAVKFLKEHSLFVVTEGLTLDRRQLMPAVENVTEQFGLPTLKTKKQLMYFIDHLSKNKHRDPVISIKECAKNLSLTVLVVDRRNPLMGKTFTVDSDLYLDNIFITSVKSDSKVGNRTDLFRDSLRVLFSTSAEVIYDDFKRLSPEATQGVICAEELSRDFQLQSTYTNNYSSVKSYLPSLKKSNVEEEFKDILSDRDNMILLERSMFTANRFENAMALLLFSAMKNLMPVHTIITHDQDLNQYRCRLFILHEFVSEAVHQNRETTKRLAAVACLFQLYQTLPTILIDSEDDTAPDITFEAMKARAAKLKEESGMTGPEEDDEIQITHKELRQYSHVETDDVEREDEDNPQTVTVNIWIGKAAECFMKEHFSKETLQSLIFGPGPDSDYFAYIRMLVNKHKHNSSTRKKTNTLFVQDQYPMPTLLDILRKNGGQIDRYSIVPKCDLPKPSELTEEKCVAFAKQNQKKP